MSGDAGLKKEQLLGGDSKINQSLLLGGNRPIADHLLLVPRSENAEAKHDEDDRDIEHLDYLESADDVPLASARKSRRQLPKITKKAAIIAATTLVLLLCLIIAIVAMSGKTHPLGQGDYRA